jgi:hypothetical protein
MDLVNKKESGTREGMSCSTLQAVLISQLWSDSAAFHSLAEIRIATSKRLEFPPTK